MWKAELMWKSHDLLQEELQKGKSIWKELTVEQFVFPYAINKNAISVIENLGKDYSRIIYKNDRKVDMRYIVNNTRRWRYRAVRKIDIRGYWIMESIKN